MGYILCTWAPQLHQQVRREMTLIRYSLMKRRNRVHYSYTNGFMGFAARLSKEEAQLIAQRPGVVSVFPDPVLKLHTTRSWDFMKYRSGVEISSHSSSNSTSHGEDTIIGILDTGIWPESKSFNDEDPTIPSKWKGTCTEGPDFTLANCNRKLIGARYYNVVESLSSTSSSPRDKVGHGTHVTATAAGSPVQGASYRGLAKGIARGGFPGVQNCDVPCLFCQWLPRIVYSKSI